MAKTTTISKLPPIRHGRQIFGASAILLPFSAPGVVDWQAFEAHVARTAEVGLVPAVNMDTGYAHLLTAEQRTEALDRTQSVLSGEQFFAGTVVRDTPGDAFAPQAYAEEMSAIASRGGTPVVFQSYGLTQQADEAIVAAYQLLGRECDRFVGFELGNMFAPFGKIYSLEVFKQIVQIDACMGLKHSSLDRQLEWDRLVVRDEVRPEFKLFTGNDLAIDMVMYGSDYLLGLSTFAPDAFALRDKCWAEGDPAFFELNDLLQYLGAFAFRNPVPAYKHSAAMFLHERGWITTDHTHPDSPERPASDRAVLAEIWKDLEARL